jgi:hypothetical protein
VERFWAAIARGEFDTDAAAEISADHFGSGKNSDTAPANERPAALSSDGPA